MTEPFKDWVVLELMGHRRLAGLLSEQEIAGHGFLRLDIPGSDGVEPTTQFYSPTAVYAVTPTTEALARQVAAMSRPEPVSRWELPQLEASNPVAAPDSPFGDPQEPESPYEHGYPTDPQDDDD